MEDGVPADLRTRLDIQVFVVSAHATAKSKKERLLSV